MNLKKINLHLQKSLVEMQLLEPTEIQIECFSALKSGKDVVVIDSNQQGKTTLLALTLIQKLEKAVGESTRAVVFLKDKESVLNFIDLFTSMSKYTNLRFIGVNDNTDIDQEKNQISAGMDVLVGTPNKINALFSGAGFNMNTIKLFAVDDADIQFKNRYDSIIQRLSMSIEKTQRVFFAQNLTEKLFNFTETNCIEPIYFGVDFQNE